MSQLQISNVVDVSVSQSPSGLGSYNTSNIAILASTARLDAGTNPFYIYSEPSQVGNDYGTGSTVYALAVAIFSQRPNILAGGGYLVIIGLGLTETVAAAISRSQSQVQYFGILTEDLISAALLPAVSAVVQSLNKIIFSASSTVADITGAFATIKGSSLDQTRCLFYGTTGRDALLFAAAYASRALSVNFSGSNTTSTMHLKDLKGINADPTVDQTLLEACKIAGVDTYVSIQGVSKVFCTGANRFFDQVYNQLWFVGSLKISGFNYLAQSATKIPQTEAGIAGLKGAYRQVCEQAIANQYGAPGSWDSPTTFGILDDLIANIAQRGYYIFSAPVSKQLTADRVARKAPLVQIALKEAGAAQSSFVIVNVNA